MKEQNILLWILTAIAAYVFALQAISNLAISIRQVRLKSSETLLLLVGGLAGVVAVLLMPVEGVRRYWWIPLLVDMGSLPIVVWVIIRRCFICRRSCPAEQAMEYNGVPRARVSLRDRIGVEMFWRKRKREMRMYSVSDLLAWEWPRVLLPLGFSVYVGDKWANIASAFNGGCPWGQVSDSGHVVQMGSEFMTKEQSPQRLGDSPPGYYMQLVFVKESQPLADQIDAILREHGATLVRSETQ